MPLVLLLPVLRLLLQHLQQRMSNITSTIVTITYEKSVSLRMQILSVVLTYCRDGAHYGLEYVCYC